MLQNHLEKCR